MNPQREAVIDDSGRYRYLLRRRWSQGPSIAFVMLNPSTADGMADDPTVRRCVGFARQWGYGELLVVNLFAWRATDPRHLLHAPDPIGPHNDLHIEAAARNSALVVLAWGQQPFGRGRQRDVVEILGKTDRQLYQLGATMDGSPRHPLYVPKAQDPEQVTLGELRARLP